MFHSHQVTFLPPVHTQEPLRSQSCAARHLWVEAGQMTGFSVCAAGWVTVEVRGSLFSTAPSHSSKWCSKKGSDRWVWGDDSEASRQLVSVPAGFALPSTSWGPSARGVKQGAHCDINTQRGWVCRCELQRRSLWGWDYSMTRGGVRLVQEVSKSRTKAGERARNSPAAEGRNTPEKHFAYKHLVLQL